MSFTLNSQALEILGDMALSETGWRSVLEDRCCGNPTLRTAVEELWRDYQSANSLGWLASPAIDMLSVDRTARSTDSFEAVIDNRSTYGRFELLRRLGKGGQGEVWLAIDPTLGREVALKIIPPNLHHSELVIAKLRLEAEVTGRLEHPNIVPIYEAGRDTRQLPFYVMRVFREDNLQVAIERFNRSDRPESGLRDLLGRFVDVCDAVAYAHSRGVIHRDLKPQNVVLGEFGETLVVDWGVAKVIGQTEPQKTETELTHQKHEDDGLFRTQAGDIFGTVEYMSPEQAEGRIADVGFASDQYSLGAILYCLLTGQAPIGAEIKPTRRTASNRNHVLRQTTAANANLVDETWPANPSPPRLPFQELLRRAIRGEFIRPRTLDSQVPVTLEAICLKAMALNGVDRYPSVLELVQDVKCWLNDETVLACRDSIQVRARRWIKRHRAASAAIAMTFIAGAVFGIVQWRHSTKLNAQKVIASKEAAGRQKALTFAVESLEAQTELIRDENLLRHPQMLSLRLRLLQHAMNSYEKWATPDVDTRELVVRVATQLLQVAESVEETIPELQFLQNGVDRETSESAVKQAQERLSAYLEHHRDDHELELLLASAGRQRAEILLNRENDIESEQQCRSSLAMTDRLLSQSALTSNADLLKATVERSRMIRCMARIQYQRAISASNPDERKQHLTTALSLLVPLKDSLNVLDRHDVSLGLEFASVLNAIGISKHKGGRHPDGSSLLRTKSTSPSIELPAGVPFPEYVSAFQQAIAICESVRSMQSDSQSSQSKQIAVDRLEAQICNNLALSVRSVLRETPHWETPLVIHQRSRMLRQGVLDRFPWMLSVRMELAQTLGNIADTLSDSRDTNREIVARRQAVDLLRELVQEFPSALKVREFWALHRIRWMTALHRSVDDQQAAQVFEETVRWESNPENAEPTNTGHLFDTSLGWALLADQDTNRREAAHEKMESLLLLCHSLGGFQSPIIRSKILQDPLFATVRNRPRLQELLQASSETTAILQEPKN